MTLTLRDLLQLPGAAFRADDTLLDRPLPRISTDSRSLQSGDVFLAIRGDRFDGHVFVREAVDRLGACLAVVNERWVRRDRRMSAGLPLVTVPDTLDAYGAIARMHRDRFDIPVLLVTGSNGKTSCKEMIAAVLATRFRVLHTEGNFNNRIGLPATLLRLDASHQVAVLEAGTNQPGDIPALCAAAGHTHAAITNIGRAHIERLLSREGIAAEKSAVFASLPRGGVAFVNADEPLLRGSVPRRAGRVSFGYARSADVRVVSVEMDALACPVVRIEAPAHTARPVVLRLRIPGTHAALNAAMALAVGLSFGCGVTKMKAALEAYDGTKGRLDVRQAAGITVIDDSYNANPDSMRAAIGVLVGMRREGRTVAALGDMLELGRDAVREHRELGAFLAANGVDFVCTTGTLARHIALGARNGSTQAAHFASREELTAALDALLDTGDVVLVKGSRGARMDEIAAFLRTRPLPPMPPSETEARS